MSKTRVPVRRTLRTRFRDWRGALTRSVIRPETETLLSLAPDEVARLVKNARQS